MIVSNSGPIIELAKIGELHQLRQTYDQLIIPVEVHHEIVVAGHGLPGADEVSRADWIQVRPISAPAAISQLQVKYPRLGLGEAAAIVLARDEQATRLLIDDLLGRKAARAEGVPVVGTLATLILAKQLGHLANVSQVLDKLVAGSFRISTSLYREVLLAAGELT